MRRASIVLTGAVFSFKAFFGCIKLFVYRLKKKQKGFVELDSIVIWMTTMKAEQKAERINYW